MGTFDPIPLLGASPRPRVPRWKAWPRRLSPTSSSSWSPVLPVTRVTWVRVPPACLQRGDRPAPSTLSLADAGSSAGGRGAFRSEWSLGPALASQAGREDLRPVGEPGKLPPRRVPARGSVRKRGAFAAPRSRSGRTIRAALPSLPRAPRRSSPAGPTWLPGSPGGSAGGVGLIQPFEALSPAAGWIHLCSH